MRRGGSLYLSPFVAIEMANLSWIAELSWFRVSEQNYQIDIFKNRISVACVVEVFPVVTLFVKQARQTLLVTKYKVD